MVKSSKRVRSDPTTKYKSYEDVDHKVVLERVVEKYMLCLDTLSIVRTIFGYSFTERKNKRHTR